MQSLVVLVTRTQSGDGQAEVELFDRLRPYIRALVNSDDCVPSGSQRQLDGSDLTQSVLLRIAMSLADFRGTTDPELRAWIRSIVRHQSINLLRRAKRVATLEFNGAHAPQNGHPLADDSTPSEKLIRSERVHRLAEALERLPDEQRDAIRWRHLENLSLEEVGRRLGNRSRGAVAQLIRRGIVRLNEILNRDD